MKAIIALVVLTSLTACSDPEELAVATGPVFALNTNHWQATPADLQLPKSGRTE